MRPHWFSRFSPTLAWWLVFLAAAVVLLAAEWPLLRCQYSPIWDADCYFAPYYVHLADHARAGQFLLWDPWTSGGLPTAAHPEHGTYSPLTIAAAWLTGPTLRGFVLYWLGLWMLGGMGMLFLARHLGAPPWGALVVMLAFMFSGFFIGHAEHTSWTYSYAAFPWIIWRLDVAFSRRRTLAAVEAGAIWGVSALAGYPGVVLAAAMTAGFWLLGRSVFGHGSDFEPPQWQEPASDDHVVARLLRAGWLLAVWAIVGVVVMSPTYLTFLNETPGYTERSGPLPRNVVVASNSLSPRCLLSLGTPCVPEWSFMNQNWSYTDPSSGSLYMGFCVSWLAVGALIMRPRSAWRWWLAALAVTGVALALGLSLPFRGWLYDYFPPSRYFRHPSLFGSVTIFACCALAALASGDVAKARRGLGRSRAAAMLAATVLLAIGGIAAYCRAAALSPVAVVLAWEAELHAWIGWLALIPLVLLAVAAGQRPWGRVVFVTALCILALVDALGTGLLTRTITCYCWTTDIATDWKRLLHQRPKSLDLAAMTGLDRRAEVSIMPSQGVKHLLMKTPVLRAATSMSSPFYKKWTDTPVLLDAATGSQRIWFAPQAVKTPLTRTAFDAFCARAKKLGTPPLVIHAPQEMVRSRQAIAPQGNRSATILAEAPAARRIDVHLGHYTPNTLDFEVDCPADGWLVVTDRWARGWQATVDGQPTPVYGGMYLFRAVQVHAGQNEVQFTYCPWGHPWLAGISYVTLGGVFVASVAGRVLHRRKEGQGIGPPHAALYRRVSHDLTVRSTEYQTKPVQRRTASARERVSVDKTGGHPI
jgi:hypothetical protein